MVEFGNNLDPDEEYDVLLNILDFPIECVEGDEVAVDWDISNAQFLGPIPSNVLLELPMTSNEELNAPNSFPRPAAPIAAAPKHVDSSSLRIPRQRKFAKVQSPVSVLESNGSCYREKGLSIKSEHAIPARSRSKRVRYSGINPWLLTARELSKCKRTSNARSKESRKRLFQQPISIDLMRKSPENVDNSLTVLNPARQVASNPRDALVKKCAHCQSTETPLWREGPLGPKTLCNACGVRYRSGRLFPEYRPAASPTFVPSQHSNSHRKVEEMRTEAKRLKVKIKIGGAPVQKQLIMPVERVQLAKNVDTSSSPKRKLLAKYDDTSSSQIPLQNKTANVQKSCAFSTQSRVSLLQSSSYLRYRSKYVEPAGANLGLPPSSCKKASNSMRGKESRKKLFEAPVAVAVDVMKNSPINEDASLDVLDPVRLQNVSNSMRGKDSRKKLCQLPVAVAVDVMKNSHKNDETSLDVSDPVCLLNASNSTRGKESRKKILQLPFAIDVMKNSPRNDEASLGVSDPAPLQNASNSMRGKESRKKLCKLTVAVEVMKNSHKNSKTPLDVPNPVHRQNGSNPSCPAIIKKCAHCQSTKTPQWREGLLGPQTLCNACGLRYRSGRLLPEYRPAASPTFMPSQNSNSHRKLMQMRVEAM